MFRYGTIYTDIKDLRRVEGDYDRNSFDPKKRVATTLVWLAAHRQGVTARG
jgi:hypothetical protein